MTMFPISDRLLRKAVACAAGLLALQLLASAPLHAQRRARATVAPQIAATEPGAIPMAPGAAMAPAAAPASTGGDALPTAPGPGAAVGPTAPGATAAAAGAPSKEELNETLLYEREPLSRVRIAILNATGKPAGAAKVAVLLGDYRRRPLEDKLGLKIELVNISSSDQKPQTPAVVYYRQGFLRAALILARAIPGDTMVAAMRPEALKRAGVDVEVVVGEELP
jgi:hypothetical protein